MRAVELFAGAGGLALGVSRAGFSMQAVVEREPIACETIRRNQERGMREVIDWPLLQSDVTQLDFRSIQGPVDLLSGGPPCQPFSVAGKQRAHHDRRNMFPEMVRAIRELSPRAILIENVSGLLHGPLGRYFEYLTLQIAAPDLVKKHREKWPEHLTRLRRQTKRRRGGLSYSVSWANLQAADFGVPQLRRRVFIVAFRSDVPNTWTFPTPTHSLDSLLVEQWITGRYWERRQLKRPSRDLMPSRFGPRIDRLMASQERPRMAPWATVRDAISDLPRATREATTQGVANHVFVPGARSYPNHTGCPMDFPAKTLKAGAHGVPGGENTLHVSNGVRYFTIRECARLQTVPDEYEFTGGWMAMVKQIGNAVPVRLAEVIASEIRKQLVMAALTSLSPYAKEMPLAS